MEDQGFRIGEVQIPGKLVLGPMAGVTDLPFRLLCKEQGADLVYTEMISAKGIYYKNKNRAALDDGGKGTSAGVAVVWFGAGVDGRDVSTD